MLLEIPVHAVRVAVASLINGLAALIERVFGLPPQSLGRLELPKFQSTVDVPVGVIPPSPPSPVASVAELKRRALAQKVMCGVLDQACAAIEQKNPDQLPGAKVKDDEVQAARVQVLKSIEESNGQAEQDEDDQDDGDQYPQERPR